LQNPSFRLRQGAGRRIFSLVNRGHSPIAGKAPPVMPTAMYSSFVDGLLTVEFELKNHIFEISDIEQIPL
jgi:hypothetical protein